ncbi:MAG TPA: DUF3617 family protein [Terracidiphilus sp.]|nr:DUF3617 family protein [Terracidiphilus sp.]
MRLHRPVFAVSLCIVLLGVFAWAQGRKPGLYEVTSKMTWQQSPFPGGMGPGGGAHTTQVCVTQEQIDKYGDVPPQTRSNCQVTDIKKESSSMHATITCSAPMAGTGTVETRWNSADSSHSTIHFTGNMQMGSDSKTIEWTVESDSTYKGADCGSVKPIAAR